MHTIHEFSLSYTLNKNTLIINNRIKVLDGTYNSMIFKNSVVNSIDYKLGFKNEQQDKLEEYKKDIESRKNKTKDLFMKFLKLIYNIYYYIPFKSFKYLYRFCRFIFKIIFYLFLGLSYFLPRWFFTKLLGSFLYNIFVYLNNNYFRVVADKVKIEAPQSKYFEIIAHDIWDFFKQYIENKSSVDDIKKRFEKSFTDKSDKNLDRESWPGLLLDFTTDLPKILTVLAGKFLKFLGEAGLEGSDLGLGFLSMIKTILQAAGISTEVVDEAKVEAATFGVGI